MATAKKGTKKTTLVTGTTVKNKSVLIDKRQPELVEENRPNVVAFMMPESDRNVDSGGTLITNEVKTAIVNHEMQKTRRSVLRNLNNANSVMYLTDTDIDEINSENAKRGKGHLSNLYQIVGLSILLGVTIGCIIYRRKVASQLALLGISTDL